jgi:hypothetical protein
MTETTKNNKLHRSDKAHKQGNLVGCAQVSTQEKTLDLLLDALKAWDVNECSPTRYEVDRVSGRVCTEPSPSHMKATPPLNCATTRYVHARADPLYLPPHHRSLHTDTPDTLYKYPLT